MKQKRGCPLKMRELRAMPNGSVVWMVYVEAGSVVPRVNCAASIEKIGEDYWETEPGSFQANAGLKDGDDAIETCAQGETRLYKVIK